MESTHQRWLNHELAQIRFSGGDEGSFDMKSRLLIDLHFDSLEMMELIAAIEKYTQQTLEEKIWMEWYRLQDVLNYLESTNNCMT